MGDEVTFLCMHLFILLHTGAFMQYTHKFRENLGLIASALSRYCFNMYPAPFFKHCKHTSCLYLCYIGNGCDNT